MPGAPTWPFRASFSRFHWDNPVARHAGRIATGKHWPWAVLGLLLCAGGLGILLQKYWMELEVYSFLQPQAAARWTGLTLLSEAALALPWAAIRGSMLWIRLRRDGHLDEYRRSRLSPVTISLGLLSAALYPVLVLLIGSLGLSLAVALLSRGLLLSEIVTAHLLLSLQCIAFAALGLCLAGRLRHPGFAIPVAILVLALAICLIWALNPFYRSLPDPAPWIYGALLPNPVTAVGNALNTDVLRFSWVYERIRAVDYFYVYPPAWQTGGLYLAAAILLLWRVGRRINYEE